MTKIGNDGFTLGIAGTPRCSTMGRITVALRLMALAGLLTAGTLEALPDDGPAHSYVHELRRKVDRATHFSEWTSAKTLVAHRK